MISLFVLVVVKINSVNISSGAAVKAAKLNQSLSASPSGDKTDDSDNQSHFSIFKFVNNFIPSKN